MTQNTIQFRATSNTFNGWVMRITADRRIEVAEGVDVNEAAKKVLEAMQWMLDKQKRTWVGLTDEQVYEIGFDWNIGGIQTMKAYKDIEAKLKEKNT